MFDNNRRDIFRLVDTPLIGQRSVGMEWAPTITNNIQTSTPKFVSKPMTNGSVVYSVLKRHPILFLSALIGTYLTLQIKLLALNI